MKAGHGAPTMLALAVLAGGAAADDNCGPIRDRIEARIRAGGVSRFSLAVVEAAASAAGRTVGQCDLGRKRIVYRPEPGAAPAPAGRDEAILTECRDGRVITGGSCRR